MADNARGTLAGATQVVNIADGGTQKILYILVLTPPATTIVCFLFLNGNGPTRLATLGPPLYVIVCYV